MIDRVGEERRGVIGNLSRVEVLSSFGREILEEGKIIAWLNALNHWATSHLQVRFYFLSQRKIKREDTWTMRMERRRSKYFLIKWIIRKSKYFPINFKITLQTLPKKRLCYWIVIIFLLIHRVQTGKAVLFSLMLIHPDYFCNWHFLQCKQYLNWYSVCFHLFLI